MVRHPPVEPSSHRQRTRASPAQLDVVKKAPAPAWPLRLPGTCPFARERRVMEGTSGWSTLGLFAEARRHATLPSGAPCKGCSTSAAPPPLRVAPDRRGRAIATRGAWSDRGWGQVSGASNRDRECRASVARPLTSRTSGGCFVSEGDFRASPSSRLDRALRGSRCSSGPWSCSWRYPPAEVARARAASIRPVKTARGEV
jgi:hypothetical protein